MLNFFKRLVANAKIERAKETPETKNIFERYESDKLVVGLTLSSKDYGWSSSDKSIKVKLLNPSACADNPEFSTWNIMGMLNGTGHVEWEAILATVLMEAVCNWKKNKDNSKDETADISDMFNRDLLSSKKIFKKKDIDKFLGRIFKTERIESDGTRFVRFKVA